MKWLRFITYIIISGSLLSFVIDQNIVYNKDIYLKAEDVNIKRYVNSDMIFAIKCDYVKDTTLVCYINDLLLDSNDKPNSSNFGILLSKKDKYGNLERRFFNSSSKISFISRDFATEYLNEKKHIEDWLKQLDVNKLIKQKKSNYNKNKHFRLSFRYYLIPAK